MQTKSPPGDVIVFEEELRVNRIGVVVAAQTKGPEDRDEKETYNLRDGEWPDFPLNLPAIGRKR